MGKMCDVIYDFFNFRTKPQCPIGHKWDLMTAIGSLLTKSRTQRPLRERSSEAESFSYFFFERLVRLVVRKVLVFVIVFV